MAASENGGGGLVAAGLTLQVYLAASLAAAGLSGGNWLPQGRCRAGVLAPLLMVLLL